MDSTYVPALFGLVGASIGGLTSFGTTWATQRVQLRAAHLESARAKREELFKDFISEASRLYGDALSHEKDNAIDLVQLYALLARMRLVASPEVIKLGEEVLDKIIDTYLGPNRALHELRDLMREGGMNFLTHFGNACRDELTAVAQGKYQ